MDPLTHAVVGLAIGTVAGGDFSVNNGLLVASTIGALAPDFDIVLQAWGDYSYLKHHRGFSHSLPGIGAFSIAISGLLSLFFPEIGLFQLFLWTFLGAFSHSFLDIFNSYGAQLLWPFSRKMLTANLLMIYDPVLTLCCLAQIIWGGKVQNLHFYTLSIFITYLFVRYLMRTWAGNLLYSRLKRNHNINFIVLLPHLFSLTRWDFIVKTEQRTIVGNMDMIKRDYLIQKTLLSIKKEVKEVLLATKMGEVFLKFTPLPHVLCEKQGDKLVGRFIDLRYLVKDRFLHNATVVMTNDYQVQEAFFHPYSFCKNIKIE